MVDGPLEALSFGSGSTRCDAWFVPAATDELTTPAGAPCVVMAHGFGGTRDGALLPFARRFATAGLHVLGFDYRGFGTSAGTPRQDVNHWRQRRDYRAAIGAARARPDVDPARVAVWGTSYSGGHVLAVAARDPRVLAVVSQGPATDGLAVMANARRSARRAGRSSTGKGAALGKAIARDLGRAVTGRTPVLVPLAGEPGSGAVISTPDAVAQFASIMGPTFRNEMCARGLLRLPVNRPVTGAGRIRCPTMMVLAEQDDITPASAARKALRRIGNRAPTELLSLPVNHLDIYAGETFEISVAAQVEFLRRVAQPGGA